MENFNATIDAINTIKRAENIMRGMFFDATNSNDADTYDAIENKLRDIRIDIAIACGICTRNFNKPCTNCGVCSESEWA